MSRLFRLLKKPHLIPKKIFDRFMFFILCFFYDEKKYYEIQKKLFHNADLDLEGTDERLAEIYSKNPNIEKDMSSAHHNVFVSIQKKNVKIKEILEIGTFSGSGAALLSELFPDARITTIDLNDDHDLFKNTYERKDYLQRQKFIENRNKLLSCYENIEFKQMNSLALTFVNKKYDLIWVDGAHGYPVATCDIVNSLRLISAKGFLVCDDVYTRAIKNDEMYSSTATYETLVALSEAGLIGYNLVLKRTVKPWGRTFFRKYIAVVRKI